MFNLNKKEPIRLQSWTVLPCKYDDGEGYFLFAPHPTKTGKMRKTSPIHSCVGNIAVTESGSQYALGMPAVEYVEWLNSKGLEFSPLKPIPDELLWKPNEVNNK